MLRALSDRGAQDWRAVVAGRLFREATAEGGLVATEEVTLTKELPVLDQDLAAKPDGAHPGYGEACFERMLGQAFAVARRGVRLAGARMLYHALPR